MGRLREEGQKILKDLDIDLNVPRMVFELGSAWSDPAVLAELGFKSQADWSFSQLGFEIGQGAGHPNVIRFGNWFNREVAISQGRIHLYQDRIPARMQVREYTSVLLALMGDGNRLVCTSLVGDLGNKIPVSTLVQPSQMECGDITDRFLKDGEFAGPDQLLWLNENDNNVKISRPGTRQAFLQAADYSGLNAWPVPTRGFVIPGPGFVGAQMRKVLSHQFFDTVGMSIIYSLFLVGRENMERQDPIEVMATSMISDDHDLPDNVEIQAMGKKYAPQLARFIAYLAEHSWNPQG